MSGESEIRPPFPCPDGLLSALVALAVNKYRRDEGEEQTANFLRTRTASGRRLRYLRRRKCVVTNW